MRIFPDTTRAIMYANDVQHIVERHGGNQKWSHLCATCYFPRATANLTCMILSRDAGFFLPDCLAQLLVFYACCRCRTNRRLTMDSTSSTNENHQQHHEWLNAIFVDPVQEEQQHHQTTHPRHQIVRHPLFIIGAHSDRPQTPQLCLKNVHGRMQRFKTSSQGAIHYFFEIAIPNNNNNVKLADAIKRIQHDLRYALHLKEENNKWSKSSALSGSQLIMSSARQTSDLLLPVDAKVKWIERILGPHKTSPNHVKVNVVIEVANVFRVDATDANIVVWNLVKLKLV